MNTLQFTDEELDRFGTALFHASSLLNHSFPQTANEFQDVADAAELRQLLARFLEARVQRNLDEDNTPAPRTRRR